MVLDQKKDQQKTSSHELREDKFAIAYLYGIAGLIDKVCTSYGN